MSGPGGSPDVVVGVGANVNDFTQGTRNASDAWAQFAQTVTQQNAAIQSSLASLNASFASFAQGFNALNLGQQSFQKETENTHSAISNNLIGGFTKFAFSFNQAMDFFRNGKEVLVGFVDTLTKIPREMAAIPWDIATGFLQRNLGMPSFGAMPDAALDESWKLNVNTEKALGAWRFLYGSGNKYQSGTDPAVAQLMGWTSQYSMDVPYTRQDMIQAITALGRMGLSSKDVQSFMPTVADLGVLNPDRNLTQAAFAIQGAMHGYTRMLRYDYGIDPRQLAPFGLQITGMDTIANPDQLLPALQKWEQARGLGGSAKYAATHTWWGEWSSFQDRLQNILLEAGGTDLQGNIRQGSLFGRMKGDLQNLTNWMDNTDNKKVLFEWADAFQNALGGGVKFATNAVQGFFRGLQESGAGNVVFDGLKAFGSWINSPQTSAALQNIGAALGRFGGPVLQSAGGAAQGFLSGFLSTDAVSGVKDAMDGLGKWFADPQHKKDIQDFTDKLGQLTGHIVDAATQIGKIVIPVLGPVLQAAGNILQLAGQGFNAVGEFFDAAQYESDLGYIHSMKNYGPTGTDQDTEWVQKMQQYMKTNPFGKGISYDQRYLEEEAAQAYFQYVSPNNASQDYQQWLMNYYYALNPNDPNNPNLPNGKQKPLAPVKHNGVGGLGGNNARDYWASLSPAEKRAIDAFTMPGQIDPNTGMPLSWYGPNSGYNQNERLAGLDSRDDQILAAYNAASADAATQDIKKKGGDAGTAYLQAFHDAIVKSDTGTQVAKTFAQQLQLGFQNNSGGFATALTNAITAVSQQVVNATLANYTAAANAGARAPGGTRTGRYQPGVS